jgi:hypothetical protein
VTLLQHPESLPDPGSRAQIHAQHSGRTHHNFPVSVFFAPWQPGDLARQRGVELHDVDSWLAENSQRPA